MLTGAEKGEVCPAVCVLVEVRLGPFGLPFQVKLPLPSATTLVS